MSRSGGELVQRNVLGVGEGNVGGKSVLWKYEFLTTHERRVEQNEWLESTVNAADDCFYFMYRHV